MWTHGTVQAGREGRGAFNFGRQQLQQGLDAVEQAGRVGRLNSDRTRRDRQIVCAGHRRGGAVLIECKYDGVATGGAAARFRDFVVPSGGGREFLNQVIGGEARAGTGGGNDGRFCIEAKRSGLLLDGNRLGNEA